MPLTSTKNFDRRCAEIRALLKHNVYHENGPPKTPNILCIRVKDRLGKEKAEQWADKERAGVKNSRSFVEYRNRTDGDDDERDDQEDVLVIYRGKCVHCEKRYAEHITDTFQCLFMSTTYTEPDEIDHGSDWDEFKTRGNPI